MADNIIKRLIALVMDKDSAKKTQDDVNSLTGAIDSSFKNLGKKIAGYLAVGAIFNGLKNLGIAAVQQASDAEKAWSSLKNTIDNTGDSFDAMEEKIRASADAFQDATIHDDDAFAKSLDRLVTLTGDASASLNNMGLVANVAAKFFDGDLAPATDLVAKAMNGNINALKKMGIQAKDAQSALEILAQRSFGAAEKEAATFDGQLKQLSNSWDDVLKDLGNAIISSDGATDSFSVLRAAVQTLGQWVADNREEISLWVTNGVKFAIDAADVFIRAVTGMASIIKGGLSSALGLAAVGIGKLVQGYAFLRQIEDDVREKLGQDVTERRENTKAIMENAKALQEWGKSAFNAGKDAIAGGIDRLSTRLFSSDQFSGPKGRKPPAQLEVNAPKVGKNVQTDESQAIQKAIEDYQKAGKSINAMHNLLGDSFDSLGADIERTTKLLTAFAENGADPAAYGFANLGKQLQDLQNMGPPVTKILTDLTKQVGQDLAVATANGATGLEKLQVEAKDTAQALGELLKHPDQEGAAQAIATLSTKLTDLNTAIKTMAKDQEFTEALKEMGTTLREDTYFGALDAEDGLSKLQRERQALTKAIQVGIATGKQEDAQFKGLVVRYKEVTKAINEQSDAMMYQAAAADFLAEALGVALQGGIHEAAAQKAKQTGIEALEWLVRAGAYALFGNFAGAAGALKTAASFGAVSVAWAALAAATPSKGGGSSASAGGASIPSSGSALTGGGDDVSSARDTSANAARNASPPAPEVSIYMVGPGFDMLNPQVQRVVRGASQEAAERYGNAKVRVVPSGA